MILAWASPFNATHHIHKMIIELLRSFTNSFTKFTYKKTDYFAMFNTVP